jgi:hypothetical protein
MDEAKVDGGFLPGSLFFEQAGAMRQGRLDGPRRSEFMKDS